MKTDKVYVGSAGKGREDVLDCVERYADYYGIQGKTRMHLRLIAEELLGMVSEIGREFDAEFCIEGDEKTCRICLEAEIEKMNSVKRSTLINASTTQKNAAAKGFMSRIKDIFECYWLDYRDEISDFTTADYSSVITSFGMNDTESIPNEWRLSQYRDNVERLKETERIEEWDEMEKSILANLADDVSVGVKGETVEVVITKTL